jgi:hypothetical protein
MSERWLTFEEARDAVKSGLATSVGGAEALVESARKSGEVRTEEPIFLNMDGIVGTRPLTQVGERRFSEDDLLDWLGRHHTEAAASPEPKPRARNKRSRVVSAIQELWPDGPPDQSVLSNSLLCKKVGDWLKADCQKQNVPVAIPSDDTIWRAAGRK